MSEAVSVGSVGLGCERARGKVMIPYCSGEFLKTGRYVAPIAGLEKIKPLSSSAVLSLECSALTVLAEAPCVWGSAENVEICLGLFVLPG